MYLANIYNGQDNKSYICLMHNDATEKVVLYSAENGFSVHDVKFLRQRIGVADVLLVRKLIKQCNDEDHLGFEIPPFYVRKRPRRGTDEFGAAQAIAIRILAVSEDAPTTDEVILARQFIALVDGAGVAFADNLLAWQEALDVAEKHSDHAKVRELTTAVALSHRQLASYYGEDE